MKIRTATMDDLNEIANVEADLTDEMYEKAAMHNEDGAWQMIFGAFAVLFSLYGKINSTNKRIIDKIFLISAIVSVIINFALTYEFVLDYGNSLGGIPMDIRSDMVSFGRLFEFWNIM